MGKSAGKSEGTGGESVRQREERERIDTWRKGAKINKEIRDKKKGK